MTLEEGAETTNGLSLDLPYSLFRQPEHRPYFAQRVLILTADPEPHLNNRAITSAETAERAAEVVQRVGFERFARRRSHGPNALF